MKKEFESILVDSSAGQHLDKLKGVYKECFIKLKNNISSISETTRALHKIKDESITESQFYSIIKELDNVSKILSNAFVDLKRIELKELRDW